MTGTAFIVGSAIAAAGALAGSAVNAISTSSTNKRQEDLMREQMAYQTGEREATQAYNSPVEQRKRFQAAGINPYLALGQMEAGNTTAMTSPSAPSLQAPQYGDVLKALSGSLNEGIQGYQGLQQTEMNNLGIEQMAIDTKYKLQDKLLDLVQKRMNIANSSADLKTKNKSLDLLDKQIKSMELDIEFLGKSMDDRLATTTANRHLAELDEKAKQLQNDWQEFQNSMLPQQRELLIANIRQAYSSINLNQANAGAAVASAALAGAQKDGVKIDNFQKNKLNYLIREGVRLDNKAKRWDTDHPSYMDRFFANSQAFDRNTGLRVNQPKWQPMSPVISSNGTTRW